MIEATTDTEQRKSYYHRAGVQVALEEGVPVLIYSTAAGAERIALRPDPGDEAGGEAMVEAAGLHYWYHRPLESWIVVHNVMHPLPARDGEYGVEQTWGTDTIFVSDNGQITVRKGYMPAKPGDTFDPVSVLYVLTAVIVFFMVMGFVYFLADCLL